ncbi:Putative choline kinase [Vanrija pseudolonga]|uniref:Choline kinase n=1 Tax=Vanrija pseudolonga TaxID=143232 RepID=A0AAF1BIN1_9TREE|nr:Putative choline kinase [Vanrija pseudolonga]
MVLTPDHRPLDATAPLSPLLLAAHPPQSPAQIPSLSGSLHSSTPVPAPGLVRRKTSTGSFSKLSEFWLDGTPSAPSTPWEDPSGVAGVKHVDLSIDAGEWRHPVFKTKVLSILRRLHVPLWTHPDLTPSRIHLQKVSGALTNAVFFVSFNPRPTPTSPSMSPLLTPTMPATDPDHPPPITSDKFPPTLLLRVYGPSSGQLINRDQELRILHQLSTTYGLGPRVYGTFLNGRVEQFFPSRALRAEELRVPEIASSIARRMRELHSVDLNLLGYEAGRDGEPMVWRNIHEWIPMAEETLTTLSQAGGKWEVWVESFGLHKLRDELETYRRFVTEHADKGKGLVFAHNDTQYGNLLLLDAELPAGVPEHHKYIVIDFEYAAPNHRGYDIANHFHEWRANYHHETLSWSLKPHFPYPTDAQREAWYRAYLSVDLSHGEEIINDAAGIKQDKVERLDREVRLWSPACSAFWCLWGVVQAGEQINNIIANTEGYVPEFDYLQYAAERLSVFRELATDLGVKF